MHSPTLGKHTRHFGELSVARSNRTRRTAALGATLALAAAQAEAGSREWNFTALLDGKPIGTHRFVLMPADAADAAGRTLSSRAQFDVKFLGITAYRYRHQTSERWSGDCLVEIVARTDDDGKVTEVRGKDSGGTFAVDARAAGKHGARTENQNAAGCVMSFAYWNPAALGAQSRLLDPGTGRFETVDITALQPATIEVRGHPTWARGIRIGGLAQPIEVWYDGQDWVGLDTWVGGGRRLSYRLP